VPTIAGQRARRFVLASGPTVNVTNTPAFSDPNGSFGSSSFGTITSAGNPRDFEFALKLNY
jgi:hypothetical protein